MNAGFVLPAYGQRSLADVLPAVGNALGVPRPLGETAFEFPRGRSYVVFLIDGLGFELLRDHAEDAPYLHSLLEEAIRAGHCPATAGVPSTTATSLTSFATALPPGHHGIVGYTSRIPGTDRLLNALKWDRAVDPRVWQPHETAFERLAESGVSVTNVNKRDFVGSGLTVASSRGGSFVGADRVGERLAAVVTASQARPSLTYLYDGDLDWTGHNLGIASEAWRQQLFMVDAAAEQLRTSLPADVRLVVIADHGMIDSPPEDRIDVDTITELTDGLLLLGGEARLRHLYARPGAVDDLAASWRSVLRARAEVVLKEEAVARGWFGAVLPEVSDRLGDVIVACTGTFAVQSKKAFPLEFGMVGMHGSLTSAEMLIPVLVV